MTKQISARPTWVYKSLATQRWKISYIQGVPKYHISYRMSQNESSTIYDYYLIFYFFFTDVSIKLSRNMLQDNALRCILIGVCTTSYSRDDNHSFGATKILHDTFEGRSLPILEYLFYMIHGQYTYF